MLITGLYPLPPSKFRFGLNKSIREELREVEDWTDREATFDQGDAFRPDVPDPMEGEVDGQVEDVRQTIDPSLNVDGASDTVDNMEGKVDG